MSQRAARQAGFQRAFVACGYLLGKRGADLTPGLAGAAGNQASAARELAQRLSDPDRAERARALAAELAPLARLLAVERLL